MHKIKSHKTVEQIAKKHRLDISFVKNQLEMGIPIEHEHTKDKDLATDIALQHLDEIPDYYTRLKKMEASAKKEHKKFKDVKITEEGLKDWFGKSKSKGKKGKRGWVDVVDGDSCAREEGETSTPKCVPSWKRALMSKKERLASQAAKRREDPNQPEKSGAAKPTYVRTERKKMKKEEVELNEVKDKPGKGSGKKDACYNKVKARYDVWPSAYASGALVKCRRVGAANWGTKTEGADGSSLPDWEGPIHDDSTRYCPKCNKDETAGECKYGENYWRMFSVPITLKSDGYDPNSPHPANEEKDHEYSMARSEISTIISAAKRLKKKMGKGEGNVEAWVQSKITKAADYLDSAADYVDSGEMKVENVSIEDANGNHYAEFIDIIKPKVLKATKGIGSAFVGEGISNEPKLKPGSGLGGGKPVYEKGKEPKPTGAKLPTLQQAHYEPDGEVIDEKCWDGYKQIGMKKKGKKLVPNCVKKEEYSNWREELSEDWQKVNRQDKTDGLSSAAVKAYRRENPGSKLQTAVTEKNPKGKKAKRRANFCRRMKGMKSKLTSAKTARDPDSRINKALRRWRCR